MAQEAYAKAVESFIARNPKSKDVYEQATQSMPGGNTRSVLFYEPFPLAMKRAEGSKLYDVVCQIKIFPEARLNYTMAKIISIPGRPRIHRPPRRVHSRSLRPLRTRHHKCHIRSRKTRPELR